MLGRRQFTIGYLLLETFWVALALAATRSAVFEWNVEANKPYTSAIPFVIPLAVWLWSIAIGGLFSRMTGGAAIGFLLFWICAAAIAVN